MRIHIIACRVLTRELSYFASQSRNQVDITWLPQGLHDTPDKLRQMLCETLESLQAQIAQNMLKHKPDVIVLGYGLCSNGVVGVAAHDIPLIVPKTDDCIALFLGSQKRYLDLFKRYNGTYWLNNGWIETSPFRTVTALKTLRQRYVEDYGEDNADFLIEQEMLWIRNYNYCGYITSPVYHAPDYPCFARESADDNGWQYVELTGDMRMLQAMTDGTWGDEEFLVCPPGYKIEASYGPDKIKAIPV